MTLLRFNLGLTSKNLNLSPLQFIKQSGFQNYILEHINIIYTIYPISTSFENAEGKSSRAIPEVSCLNNNITIDCDGESKIFASTNNVHRRWSWAMPNMPCLLYSPYSDSQNHNLSNFFSSIFMIIDAVCMQNKRTKN